MSGLLLFFKRGWGVAFPLMGNLIYITLALVSLLGIGLGGRWDGGGGVGGGGGGGGG